MSFLQWLGVLLRIAIDVREDSYCTDSCVLHEVEMLELICAILLSFVHFWSCSCSCNGMLFTVCIEVLLYSRNLHPGNELSSELNLHMLQFLSLLGDAMIPLIVLSLGCTKFIRSSFLSSVLQTECSETARQVIFIQLWPCDEASLIGSFSLGMKTGNGSFPITC